MRAKNKRGGGMMRNTLLAVAAALAIQPLGPMDINQPSYGRGIPDVQKRKAQKQARRRNRK